MRKKLSCPNHPKYKAKKMPTNNCFLCLNIYMTLKGERKPTPPPTKVMKSKKDYKRKDKFNKKWD